MKEKPTTKQVADFFEEVRTKQGWIKEETYEYLAEITGNSVHTIKKWVSGQHPCPVAAWAYMNLYLFGREV